LFTALATHSVEVLDIDQAVIRGQLTLGVLVRTTEDAEPIKVDVERAMRSMGMTVRVGVDQPGDADRRTATHVIVVLGRPLQATAIGELALRFGTLGVNIESIRRIADYPVTGLELTVSAPDDEPLRLAVVDVAAAAGVDIAVERIGIARRAKRLIVFDVDSTLITGEVIEMLADHTGTRSRVEEITAAAMRGELDFADSLRERVRVLAGLDESVLEEVRAEVVLTPGARTLVRTLKRLGFMVAVVSGGFIEIVGPLAAELGIDRAEANRLEIVDGRLTGKVVGEIVDRAGKERALRRFAADAGLPLSRTVAIGDGANDLDMLAAAGLGVAFNAKPVVRELAHTAVNVPYLDAVLFLLGISREEVEEADAADGTPTPAPPLLPTRTPPGRTGS